ncbi:prepilin-type N-terminal cleavage/methylation domain-containing protein [Candidatus Pacearchaeota archaeon]|nr:prepilin-type N-terminal cleavage/methylation domain-containing protein [Candidatus Pacearchaeota archaeon]
MFSRKGFTLVEVLVAITIIFIFLAVCTAPILPHFTRDNYIVTVTDKAFKKSGGGKDADDKYLIYTKMVSDEKSVSMTFEITDTFWEVCWTHWRYNSSDFYGFIEKGKTYYITTYGWRVPFFSWYKNILTAEEIK